MLGLSHQEPACGAGTRIGPVLRARLSVQQPPVRPHEVENGIGTNTLESPEHGCLPHLIDPGDDFVLAATHGADDLIDELPLHDVLLPQRL